MAEVRKWVDGFARDVESAGIGIDHGYVSFSPTNISLDTFSGEKGAKRLRALKARYDPTNLFSTAYPKLA
ncbi:hypothetical protein F4824DRAFT_455718 [Ustulina deusta]|nr:hypothetical protein F4824DRAFT_455718 [Ustulina deusta]